MTGVILSGGKSARMGMNKAFLEFEGKRLIDRATADVQGHLPGSDTRDKFSLRIS